MSVARTVLKAPADRGRPRPRRRETANRKDSYHAAMTELSHASLQRILLEERTALATRIDFADLEPHDVASEKQWLPYLHSFFAHAQGRVYVRGVPLRTTPPSWRAGHR